MDEQSAQVFLPPRKRCFERLRLARFGETVTCVHCESKAVVKRGTTGKDAQQWWCKHCETYFNVPVIALIPDSCSIRQLERKRYCRSARRSPQQDAIREFTLILCEGE